MKVLVTGALGYIGTQFIYNMRDVDHTLMCIDSSEKSLEQRLGIALEYNKNVIFKKYDITDDLSIYKDVDMILHLAAKVGYVDCNNHPEETQRTNIEGVKNICSLGKPTIFLSTGSVYGKLDQPCVEGLACNPETLYAQTKLQGEQIVKENLQEYTILRPATAYGLSFKMRHDLLIHTLCHDAVKGGRIDLYQPDAQRTFYHVNDLANTLKHIVCNFEQWKGETFNVGATQLNITKRGIIEEIQKYIDVDVNIVEDEDKDKRDYYVDYSKQEAIFKAERPLDIENVIKYYQGQ